jgi:hypothetical protein
LRGIAFDEKTFTFAESNEYLILFFPEPAPRFNKRDYLVFNELPNKFLIVQVLIPVIYVKISLHAGYGRLVAHFRVAVTIVIMKLPEQRLDC